MSNKNVVSGNNTKTQNSLSTKSPQKKNKLLIILLVCGVLAILVLFFAVLPIIFIRVDRLVNERIAKNATATPIAVIAQKTKTKQAATSTNLKPCTPVTTSSPDPLSISTSDPGLKTNASESYYSVYGSTYSNLVGQLNSCGPKYEGQSYAGMTMNYINWSYLLQFEASGKCKVINATVGVNVLIYYPKWDAQDASQQLVDRWNTVLANLKVHEGGHRQIDYDGGSEILQKISAISGTDCNDAKNQVNSTTSSTMDAISQKSKNYDNETNHGATQGANF